MLRQSLLRLLAPAAVLALLCVGWAAHAVGGESEPSAESAVAESAVAESAAESAGAESAPTESEAAAEPSIPGCRFTLDESLRPPAEVRAVDKPSDDGTTLILEWEPSPDDDAPPQIRESEFKSRRDLRYLPSDEKAEMAAKWQSEVGGVEAGYVILRKTTNDPEFLWLPPKVDHVRPGQPPQDHEGFVEPRETPAGSRELIDGDYAFLVPLGEDQEFRSYSPLPAEEVLWLRDQRQLKDPRRNHYDYEIRYFEGDRMSPPVTVSDVWPKGNLYNVSTTNILLIVLFCAGAILGLITLARQGANLFVRPIAGLSAVDDAVGRATEMGRPILYCPGFAYVDSVSTIASMVVLGRIARIAAEHGTDLIVPCRDPVVMTACREVVKEAYMAVGRPEAYREDRIFFVTDAQFAYAAGMVGIMTREKTATNFYMGQFYAEALILAESGMLAGSVQIAGTDSFTQLPFFVTTCDYTLMGEEFYGASAYLSREPKLLGSLKGQDYAKALIASVMVAAIVAVTFLTLKGNTGMAEWITDLLFHFQQNG